MVHLTSPVTMEHTFLTNLLLLFFLFLLSCNSISSSSSTGDERQPYIIHMDNSAIPAPFSSHENWYTSVLTSLASQPGSIPPTHLYTYTHVMHGFSAVLSMSQLKQLEQIPGHVAAYPDSYGELHTTHTPKFLGLKSNVGLWPESRYGDDMIIGIIDTGIWPERESFYDKDMPPVPDRWKGVCETGTEFNSSLCNRKLIGARSFSKGLKQLGHNISTTHDYDSPRDWFGHGTHTASTAAGSQVHGADYFGYAKGTASGIAPMARVAMYKAVFYRDTYETAASDVLAAMDQAITDGVDLMSLSLGFPPTPYYTNVMALGAFAAMERGIFVSCSAGNDGPNTYTIINGAPWITTVGAGTIDRDFLATVTLSNGAKRLQGRSIFPESLLVSNVSLYYGHGNTSKESCAYHALDPKEVTGKIVFCRADAMIDIYTQMDEVNRTGAEGAIFATDMRVSPFFFMPSVAVSLADGEVIKRYIIEATPLPTVDITFKITVLGSKPAPQIATFSSRGPYSISPWSLKPDILAPGVKVLAAWVPNRAAALIGDDYLVTDYALVSGTSMSSPHVVGVAALLRSLHRDWSTAAIRSAMMTTADLSDNTGGPIIDINTGTAATPLDFGGGHVNPNKAMDPGLVYDIGLQDYIDFLCGLNYTSSQIGIITRKPNYTCTRANLELNYPSFIVILNSNSTSSIFRRILTSVQDYPANYQVVVKAPTGMKVTVDPQMLSFGSKYSKQEFSVSVDINLGDGIGVDSDYIGNYGYLSWYEIGGKHVVTSPIVSAFAP